MADTDRISVREYIPILESIMRISLAGFGGAMAGLSLSRRAALSSSRTLLSNASATDKRKHAIHRHPPLTTGRGKDGVESLSPYAIDRELPAAWAMACMAFTGVVEFTRFVSPTGLAVDLISRFGDGNDAVAIEGTANGYSGDDANRDSATTALSSGHFSWPAEPTARSTLKTVADYAIGGSIGGALFSGSAVRTRAGKKMDAAILGTTGRGARPLSGLLPGAGLGFLAGVAIVSVDFVREVLEETFGETDVLLSEESAVPRAGEEGHSTEVNDETIPAHIKAMSNEELAKAIEDLKR